MFKEKELWLLILLGIIYFYRPLFLGDSLFFRDLYLNIFPQKQLLGDFINARALPLWTPYLSGGRPYLADVPYFSLYPTNILYVLLPALYAFNLNIVLHFMASAVCMYLFARTLGLQKVSSCIAGIVYAFCGYSLSLASHGCRLLSMPYLPLLLLCWHRYLAQERKKWFILTVIFGVLQVFAGTAEMNVISLLFLLGWSLIYPYSHSSFLQKILRWSLLGFFIIGIASVQILPTAEMVAQSSRGGGLDYTEFTHWSLHPRQLPELVFPHFFGYQDTLSPQVDYWGTQVLDEPAPYISSIYFGWIVLVLGITGGLYGFSIPDLKGFRKISKTFQVDKHQSKIVNRKSSIENPLPRKIRIFLLLLIVLALLFSLGRFLPFFRFIYLYIPMIRLFRFPIKFLVIGILPLSLLTGYASGLHFGRESAVFDPSPNSSLKERGVRSRPLWGRSGEGVKSERVPAFITGGILWGISGLFVLCTAMFWFSADFSNLFQSVMFTHSGGEVVRQGMLFSFGHAALICLLTALLYQYRRLKVRRWQHWLLAVILIFDLLFAGRRLNPSTPKEFFTVPPEGVRLVRKNIGAGRLYRAEKDPLYVLRAPSNDVLWSYRWHLEVLTAYLGAFYNIPVIYHIDVNTLGPQYIKTLRNLTALRPWEQKLPLLSAGGVTLILTSKRLSVPGIHRIAEIPNRSDLRFYLYRNQRAAERVEFVSKWKMAESDAAALDLMLSPTYDPGTFVVLQPPEPSLFEQIPESPEYAIEPESKQHCEPGKLTKIDSTMHSSHFSVENNCDGYLVFSEPYYPGWRVEIDGKPVPILRANYAFSAVFLPAGKHRAARFYCPNSLLLGVISSVVFCVFLSVHSVFTFRKPWGSIPSLKAEAG